MAGTPELAEIPVLAGARVLLVEAAYHPRITALLREGAMRVLRRAKVEVDHRLVPGALEIPIAIAMAVRTTRYEACVAIGCVIRGETIHFDLVAGESCRGLVELGIRHALPIGNGILTVDNEHQALQRADPAGEDKGGFAALAALRLLELRRSLGAPS
ncbi:6,7-dimethyl-8-ribityllumazine synthase 1 [bacterium HR40]|nr:6,7-dimethyl-8-ribityllumazine synthase 1 [bacterium HR40]